MTPGFLAFAFTAANFAVQGNTSPHTPVKLRFAPESQVRVVLARNRTRRLDQERPTSARRRAHICSSNRLKRYARIGMRRALTEPRGSASPSDSEQSTPAPLRLGAARAWTGAYVDGVQFAISAATTVRSTADGVRRVATGICHQLTEIWCWHPAHHQLE